MTSEDQTRGGSPSAGDEQTPYEVNMLTFAAARSKEITAMTECINNPCRTKLIFQSLPVHMRRRVMSHNAKRLPRRLRSAHLSQLTKSGNPTVAKSRRHRRRPKNLMEEFSRRERINRWLETHIWHAKRFHMTKRWGYSVAEAPCDKAFRACYRASSAHCLMQDISYYGCVEISGDLEALVSGFQKITSKHCGLSITAKAFVGGSREGSALIFNPDTYPYNCIGRVSYLWKPATDEKARTLWMFAHPSFYDELVNTLKLVFDMDPLDMDVSILNDSTKDTSANISEHKRVKRYSNKVGVSMIELKDTINRFQLTGPLAHAVLNDALKLAEVNEKSSDWFSEMMSNSVASRSHQTQIDFWKKVGNVLTPGELQRHIIVGLNVEDPRLYFPAKRTKAMPKQDGITNKRDLIDIPGGLSNSSLWDMEIRERLLKNKLTNHEINNRRGVTNLVPGEVCNDFDDVSKVPLILLQKPGSKNNAYKKIGYGCGWDIIIPGGYAMAFWVAFVLRGARTGGIRESSKLAFESGVHDFQPDTVAGRQEEQRQETLLRKRYFSLPPNKRVNYNKLSISSPFKCHWSMLIDDWKESAEKCDNFFVIRDVDLLRKLQCMITTKEISSDISMSNNCLVPVRVTSVNSGKISNFSLICLPNGDDKLGNPSSSLVEKPRADKNEYERRQLRKSHRILLKRLRRRAVRSRRKILEKEKRYVNLPKQDNRQIIEDYAFKMQRLWLPGVEGDVRHQCSRQTIGYVTKGEYSFTEARTCGLGFVALSSLVGLVDSRLKCLVLTRNTLSRQYRFARIEVICDA